MLADDEDEQTLEEEMGFFQRELENDEKKAQEWRPPPKRKRKDRNKQASVSSNPLVLPPLGQGRDVSQYLSLTTKNKKKKSRA